MSKSYIIITRQLQGSHILPVMLFTFPDMFVLWSDYIALKGVQHFVYECSIRVLALNCSIGECFNNESTLC